MPRRNELVHNALSCRCNSLNGKRLAAGSRPYNKVYRCLDRVFFAGNRDDDLGVRQASLDFLTEPLDRAIIAVDQKGFFGADFFDVVGDCVAGRVAAEIENAHFAVE